MSVEGFIFKVHEYMEAWHGHTALKNSEKSTTEPFTSSCLPLLPPSTLDVSKER